MKDLIKIFKKQGVGIILTLISILIVIFFHQLHVFDSLENKMYDLAFRIRGPLSGWAAREPIPRNSESFHDQNGNGKWDIGEPFEDVGDGNWNEGEDFEDLNGNSVWDDGEPFSDEGNGRWDKGLDVVIIDFDQKSYEIIPWSWPFTREVWARVVRNLARAGAKVIVFDFQFDAPDRLAEEPALKEIRSELMDRGLRELVPTHGDSAFAAAIREVQEMGTAVILASKIGYNSLEQRNELILPNDVIMSAAPRTALVDETKDPDGTTRRYYAFNMLREDPNTWYLTIAMRSAMEFLDFPPDDSLRLEGDPEEGIIQFEDIEIPTYGATSTFFINFYGPTSSAKTGDNPPWKTFDTYSLFQVVDVADVDLRDFDADIDWMDMFIDSTHWAYYIPGMGGPDESPFRDKVVLLGVSVEVFHDTKETPYFSFAGEQKLMPGVEVHANALQTIIDQNFITMYGKDKEWSEKSWVSHIFLIAILAFIAFIFLASMNPLFAGVSILVELLIFISIALGSFTNDYFWLVKLTFGNWNNINVPGKGESLYVPVVASFIGVAVTYITNVLYRFIMEQKDKRFLKNTFGTYVSPELIDQMYEEHQEPKLGGEAGYHTAFFSDIQSFSSFSEVLEPERMVALMNEYLTEMTDILLARRGTLDKYIGDAIVAFYGAPVPVEDHEFQACMTALEMDKHIAELRQKWEQEGDWPDLVHNLRHRVGLCTGEMVTGNMGSNMRMNYTMMGDTVNIAARLEASAKQYGVYIQVSESTYERVKDQFEWRTLDYVRVKGKTVPIRTYELMVEKGGLNGNQTKLLDTFHEGLELYYDQKWNDALRVFKAAEELEDMFTLRPSNPSRVYIERCMYFKENPPGEDWDKVWTLTKK